MCFNNSLCGATRLSHTRIINSYILIHDTVTSSATFGLNVYECLHDARRYANICTMGGMNALHYAAMGGAPEVAALLCSLGVDLYKRTHVGSLDPRVLADVGSTALHYAAAHGRLVGCTAGQRG